MTTQKLDTFVEHELKKGPDAAKRLSKTLERSLRITYRVVPIPRGFRTDSAMHVQCERAAHVLSPLQETAWEDAVVSFSLNSIMFDSSTLLEGGNRVLTRLFTCFRKRQKRTWHVSSRLAMVFWDFSHSLAPADAVCNQSDGSRLGRCRSARLRLVFSECILGFMILWRSCLCMKMKVSLCLYGWFKIGVSIQDQFIRKACLLSLNITYIVCTVFSFPRTCFEMESGKHAENTDVFKSLLKYQHRLERQQCSNSNSNKRVVESHWKQMSSAHNSDNVW